MDVAQKKSRRMLRLLIAGFGVAIAMMVGWGEGVKAGFKVLVLLASAVPRLSVSVVAGSLSILP